MNSLRNSLAALALATVFASVAQADAPVYFVAGGGTAETAFRSQAYVVPITNATAIAQARDILANRSSTWAASNYRVRVKIAAGADGVNRNYFKGSRPEWAWHVTEFVGFVYVDYSTGGGGTPSDNPSAPPDLPDVCYTTSPSALSADPAGFIARNGNIVELWGYTLMAEVNPAAAPSAVLNLSTRGRTSSDERMISGIVVADGPPKNVLIRVLGPSLTAFGVPNALSDPKLEVFAGPTKILENDNWRTSARAAEIEALTSLRPTDDRESAVLTTLFPGSYTIQASGGTGAAGVVLLEVYDLDQR